MRSTGSLRSVDELEVLDGGLGDPAAEVEDVREFSVKHFQPAGLRGFVPRRLLILECTTRVL